VILVDTNVILDILHGDPIWSAWSTDRLLDAASENGVALNAIILAECSSRFESVDQLLARLERLSLSIDRGTRVLPDFLIGAHAVSLNAAVLTRDPAIYRRYFPELTLITPENDHD
jgi:predicted nucleic acid-binding protein